MPEEKGSCVQRSICCIVCLLVLGGIGIGVWFAVGQPTKEEIQDFDFGGAFDNFTDSFGDFTDVLDNFTFPDGFGLDPFMGDNTTTMWDNGPSNNGLTLELLNALDDAWEANFDLAVSEWDNGTPDALTLSTRKVNVDNACKPVNNVMKVCNGNYGDTGWLGINELLSNTATGEVVSSVAKMNEYYLFNAEEAERQYTMCHEIGHGFGLPHTDENFLNADLFECMDYTKNPQNNQHPGESNFNRLASMYGTVNRRRKRRLGGGKSTTTSGSRGPRNFSKELLGRYLQITNELEGNIRAHDPSKSLWKLVHSHSHGSGYARKLSQNYVVHVRALHPH